MEDERIIKGALGIRTREGGGVDIFIDDQRLDTLLVEKFGCSWQRSEFPYHPDEGIFYSIVGEVIIAKL